MRTIELGLSEILRVAQQPWSTMTINEQKWVAAQVLRNRGTPEWDKIAFYVEANNPNFRNFSVVNDLVR